MAAGLSSSGVIEATERAFSSVKFEEQELDEEGDAVTGPGLRFTSPESNSNNEKRKCICLRYEE